MKHGLALLAAGLVLLTGALVVAWPPQALAVAAQDCAGQVEPGDPLGWRCDLVVEAPRAAFVSSPYGDHGTAAIFLIGGLAALGSGLVALRSRGQRRHPAWR